MSESDTVLREIDTIGRPPVPVIVFLSGSRRGTTLRLSGEHLRIGSSPEADVYLSDSGRGPVAERHATLTLRDGDYTLRAEPGREVWVNGAPVGERVLASGDLLEIGRRGPVLRYRVYPADAPGHKSLREAFSDCLECARHGGSGPVSRAALFLGGAPRELVTQTAVPFRVAVIGALALLLAATGVLIYRTFQLEARLRTEQLRVAELLERSERLGPEDLLAVRVELEERLGSADERLETLESRSAAAGRVFAAAHRSVVFLQGSYGFFDPASERFLRFAAIGPDGRPLTDERGEPRVRLEGDGPIVESLYTGTAFVASDRDLLVTNRHVARPWETDPAARGLVAQGLEPRLRRFVGYLPELPEPFEVAVVAASDEADLAVLRCSGVTRRVAPLAWAEAPPRPGDEVLVMGYPTGVRALLARTDRAALERMSREGPVDFWSVARRLARGGHIGPLASRGIVSQVSPAAVVYDAETTQGGSGGPVLDLEGRVVAVTSAILPEFGGSNLGVPAARGRVLLERALAAETAATAAPEGEGSPAPR